VSELWPELDYLAGQYDAEWFLDMAKRIESGQSLPAAARFFLHIAKTPAAIKVMNRHRPKVPRKILGLNRAAHCLARSEVLGKDQKKQARHDVAMAWRTSDATIRDDLGDFGKEAKALIERRVSRLSDQDRHAFLEAFHDYMVSQAERMRKK
jgi:hypothetical protein